MTRPTDVLVEARSLSVTYLPTSRWLRVFIKSAIREPVHALDHVDLTLRRGEILGVVGPNGAGKSTLFRSLIGLITPTEGSVHLFGKDAKTSDTDDRRRISFMPPDDRTLFHRQTCVENMLFRGHLLGLGRAKLPTQIAENLALVGLDHAADRAVVALSSGMRYRLMLARALLGEPEILILDEPTGPLDPLAAHDFIGLLVRLVAERNIGAIVSSHRMDDIEEMPQRVMLIDAGKVRYDGPVADLRGQAGKKRLMLGTTTEAAAIAIAEAWQARDHDLPVTRIGTELTLMTDEPIGNLLSAIPAHLADVLTLEYERANLREVMTALVREAGA